MDPSKEEMLFGRIALHNKLISQDQFDAVLDMRRKTEDVNRDFGRLMKAKGFVDDKAYRSVRKAQEKALLGKGHSAQAAKYLARGMNADGSAPGGTPGQAKPPAAVEEFRPTATFDPGSEPRHPRVSPKVGTMKPAAGGCF